MTSKIYINKSINDLQKMLLAKKSVFVIIDNNLQHLAEFFKDFPVICLEFSEQKKTLATVEEISERLLEMGADRDAFILGVGGGITTDVAGFVASIYKRGVSFAFVPTTLLSQVDASIGGKNGVNFNSYKNILGTINQPQWVYICPQLLATLPQDEFKAGIAEVLKTFILFDKEYYHKAVEYFAAVAAEAAAGGTAAKGSICSDSVREAVGEAAEGTTYGAVAVARDMELLTDIIGKCAQYKSGVVERDEFEKGERRLLNLGHTFAHSIEKLTEGKISHGYAVSMGMVIAARVACRMGAASEDFVQMLAADFARVGLPAHLADTPITSHLKVADLAAAVKKDKKVTGESIHFILPEGLENVKDVTIPLNVINEIANDLC